MTALVVRHFAHAGWPLHHANFWLVGLAAVIMLGAYAAKAWGWQRLFRSEQRPAVLTLAAAGGAASVGGIALPGRCDEVIRVRRRPALPRAAGSSFGAVALSLFLLGLLDSAAMTPARVGRARASRTSAAGCRSGSSSSRSRALLAAVVVLALPRLARLTGSSSASGSRGWVGDNATPPREAAGWAWARASRSRGCCARSAMFVLLAALGFGTDFALALAFVCASSAAAVLPVAPAGAAMQAGAGAAILVASGVHADAGRRVRHRRSGAR